jgi:hypothetical protein
MSDPRGQCPVCRRSCRLRKDGTLGAHHQAGPDCKGSGGPPVPFDPDKCGGCLEFRFMTPGLGEACASVGIERGRDGGAVLYDLLAAYHRNGHKELA